MLLCQLELSYLPKYCLCPRRSLVMTYKVRSRQRQKLYLASSINDNFVEESRRVSQSNEVAMKLTFWLGVSTALGPVLKGHSSRKVKTQAGCFADVLAVSCVISFIFQTVIISVAVEVLHLQMAFPQKRQACWEGLRSENAQEGSVHVALWDASNWLYASSFLQTCP